MQERYPVVVLLAPVLYIPGVTEPVAGVPQVSEGRGSLYRQMVRLAIRRPGVIPAMLGAAWAFRSRNWYRKPPFLPLPSRGYLRWRLETAYGDAESVPPLDELERFLIWAAEMRRLS